MVKKGYDYERRARLELIDDVGKENVLKLRDSAFCDFLALTSNGFVKLAVEVKSLTGKVKVKYYSAREKRQLVEMNRWCRFHKVKGEVWLYKKLQNKIVLIKEEIGEVVNNLKWRDA